MTPRAVVRWINAQGVHVGQSRPVSRALAQQVCRDDQARLPHLRLSVINAPEPTGGDEGSWPNLVIEANLARRGVYDLVSTIAEKYETTTAILVGRSQVPALMAARVEAVLALHAEGLGAGEISKMLDRSAAWVEGVVGKTEKRLSANGGAGR